MCAVYGVRWKGDVSGILEPTGEAAIAAYLGVNFE